MKHKGIIKYILVVCLNFLLLFGLTACDVFKESEDGEDVDYDICDESMLPEELRDIINSKKEAVFNLTYSNNTYTYIVVCAGMQERNDVGVEVEALYKDENAIYVETVLRQIASSGDAVEDTVTFPYTVIRIQKTTSPIIFKQ